MPAPRTSTPSTTTGADALLYLLFGALGTVLTSGSIAWLTGNLTNTVAGNGWVPFSATGALVHPAQLWPHLSPVVLLLFARIIPGLLTLGLLVAGCVLYLRRIHGSTRNGLARKTDITPLLTKEITAKAQNLRPSLADRERKRGRTR